MQSEGIQLELKVLHQHGWSIRQLAHEFGLNWRTVERAVTSDRPRHSPRRAKPTMLTEAQAAQVERLPAVAWAKLPALAEGARRPPAQLWGEQAPDMLAPRRHSYHGGGSSSLAAPSLAAGTADMESGRRIGYRIDFSIISLSSP
jgi:hypothetical protein